jgi:hypothetical protein
MCLKCRDNIEEAENEAMCVSFRLTHKHRNSAEENRETDSETKAKEEENTIWTNRDLHVP